MNGLRGQLAVQHVDQARNLELFKFRYNMGAKYVLEYHKGTVTQSPVQVSTIKIFVCEENEKRISWILENWHLTWSLLEKLLKKGMLDLKSFDRADEGILHTVPTAEILSGKNARMGLNGFHIR